MCEFRLLDFIFSLFYTKADTKEGAFRGFPRSALLSIYSGNIGIYHKQNITAWSAVKVSSKIIVPNDWREQHERNTIWVYPGVHKRAK